MEEYIQLSLYGKTYQEPFPATGEKISEPCWKSWQESHKTVFQYLDLRTESGQKRDSFVGMGGVLPGELWTLNFGESPNVAVESRLSWILEDNAQEKYYLSKRACQGILERAKKRGKPLPDMLTQALIITARGNGNGYLCPTIIGDHANRVTDYTPICIQGNCIDRADTAGCNGKGWKEDVSFTLNTVDRPAVMCMESSRSHAVFSTDKAGTLTCSHDPQILYKHPIIRRLTPLECERLQGYPDGWTDIGEWVDGKGKRHKTADTPRYKALGNSIALPQWQWIICNMAKYLSQHATLGSLFDGIGGFPLVWETLYGKGTAVWASEIEEFPIAVTKYHFGEE